MSNNKKFKVGDRVVIVGNDAQYPHRFDINATGFILKIDDNYCWFKSTLAWNDAGLTEKMLLTDLKHAD